MTERCSYVDAQKRRCIGHARHQGDHWFFATGYGGIPRPWRLNDDGTHPEDTPTTPEPTFTAEEMREQEHLLSAWQLSSESFQSEITRTRAMLQFAASLVRREEQRQDTPEHRCGVRGFAESGDKCPGCVASGRHD